MQEGNTEKAGRLLGIYTRLMNGDVVNVQVEAMRYKVDVRSIQRDIATIKNYLVSANENDAYTNNIVYDRKKKGHRLEKIYQKMLNNSEILAICKILLESRPFLKSEMDSILERLINCCAPELNKKMVMDMIKNEEFHYIEPRHGKSFMENMWKVAEAIHSRNYILVEYEKSTGNQVVQRKLKPVAIMFSEYYFYVTAFIDEKDEVRQDFDVMNDSFPTIYRIDRIRSLEILQEHFSIPYKDRFEEGEFRKRIQFMYGGKLQKIRFEYRGGSLEAVLDRIPTAVIESENKEQGPYIISAEVFGMGINRWIRSQGDDVRILDGRTGT